MIAVNISAWIDSTRHESDEMTHIDAVISAMRAAHKAPPKITLYEGWAALARVCTAKFWIISSGQLFILWLCSVDTTKMRRNGVEVGERRERKLSFNFGHSTIGLLFGESCFISLAVLLFTCTKQQMGGDYTGAGC